MHGNYKRYALFMLLVVYTFNFIDRQILGLLLQPIKEDLQLSDTQLGFLSGIAFALFYSTLGIPIARLADRGNRVTIISIALVLWSGATALCGLAANFLQLLLARIAVGVGEAGCTPPAHSLIADYFGRAERTRAISIYMLGIPFGILLGYLVGGWVNEWYGWRTAFLVLGVPGVVLAAVVKLTLREPIPGQLDGQVRNATTLPPFAHVFETLWNQRSFRHLMLGVSLTAFMGYGMGQWQPAFFIRSHGMTTGQLGTWLALSAGCGGAIGIYLGGYLAGSLGARDERFQLWVLSASLALTFPLSVIIYVWPSPQVALWLLVPTNVLYFMFHGPAFALVQSLADIRMRAMAAAITLLIMNLVGLGLGPQLVGILSDLLTPHLGSNGLRVALIANSFVAPWAALHYWLAGRSIREDLQAARERSLRMHAAQYAPRLAD